MKIQTTMILDTRRHRPGGGFPPGCRAFEVVAINGTIPDDKRWWLGTGITTAVIRWVLEVTATFNGQPIELAKHERTTARYRLLDAAEVAEAASHAKG